MVLGIRSTDYLSSTAGQAAGNSLSYGREEIERESDSVACNPKAISVRSYRESPQLMRHELA